MKRERERERERERLFCATGSELESTPPAALVFVILLWSLSKTKPAGRTHLILLFSSLVSHFLPVSPHLACHRHLKVYAVVHIHRHRVNYRLFLVSACSNPHEERANVNFSSSSYSLLKVFSIDLSFFFFFSPSYHLFHLKVRQARTAMSTIYCCCRVAWL